MTSVRRATGDDVHALSELAYQTFWDAFHEHPKNAPDDLADYMSTAFSLEQTIVELEDDRHIFLIAEFDSEMAGYARLTVGATEDGITAERPIELNRLYSHQRFLGKGVGQTLMDECFLLGRELGCDVMWLGVWEYNPRAQRFYEKNGFSMCGKHVFQLGSDPQTDLLMARDLFSGQPKQ